MLRVHKLHKAFGGLVATHDVSLFVERGEIVSIIGANGAGKSTLFNQISGQLKPDNGQVFFLGEEITGKPAHVVAKKGIGRCFQRSTIFPNLSVFENVEVAVLNHANSASNIWRTRNTYKAQHQKR